jgi:hypothetical protein
VLYGTRAYNIHTEEVAFNEAPHFSTYTRGVQRMRKHIDRVLLVGATVVLLAFGNPLTLPPAVGYNSDDAAKTEQTVSEY